MRSEGRSVRVGELIVVYRPLIGEPEGKRPLGSYMRRWENGTALYMWAQ
jgi:hypothetical protein